MSYIKIFILTLLLAGCAASPETDSRPEAGNQISAEPTGQEIAIYRQAITLLNNNEFEQAEIEFLNIIKSQSDLAGPWANLGLIYAKKQQYDKAEEYLLKAIDKNPKLAQAWSILGYTNIQQGNVNKAIENYQKAIAFKNDYALAHYNLALIYDTYLRNLSKAIDHYQRYLQLVDHKDQVTQDWVNELKRNMEKNPA